MVCHNAVHTSGERRVDVVQKQYRIFRTIGRTRL
uniref:Uncharacterized protein n=1 Tax=Anguilla anguilla TaxID=7936 RepID=A0A0E9UU89_ANGAN